jgi:hypothetical protein
MYQNPEEAKECVELMNEAYIDGVKIRCELINIKGRYEDIC